MVQTKASGNAGEMQAQILAVLEPEVERLKQFYHYSQTCVEKFVSYIQYFLKERPSELAQWNMVKLLDTLTFMDVIKNMKSSLNNDFSLYKRTVGVVKKDTADPMMDQKIGLFLADQNAITRKLYATLSVIDG